MYVKLSVAFHLIKIHYHFLGNFDLNLSKYCAYKPHMGAIINNININMFSYK